MNKLIKLSATHYIIVDCSRKWFNINVDSAYYSFKDKGWYKFHDQYEDLTNDDVQVTHSFGEKIEGIINKSLSEAEEAINGYSVDKMAKYHYGNHRKTREFEDGFMLGFKIAHEELTKDKNKEVIELLKNITECSSFKEHPTGKQAQKALDLLFPKTEWEVEFDEQGKIKLI